MFSLDIYTNQRHTYLYQVCIEWNWVPGLLLKFLLQLILFRHFKLPFTQIKMKHNDLVKKSEQMSVTVIIVTLDDEGLEQWWQELEELTIQNFPIKIGAVHYSNILATVWVPPKGIGPFFTSQSAFLPQQSSLSSVFTRSKWHATESLFIVRIDCSLFCSRTKKLVLVART